LVVVAAVADVHYPKYASEFLRALSQVDFSRVDLFLMVGDMVLKSRYAHYPAVVGAIRRRWGGPLLAVFGNEDYEEHEEEVIKRTPGVTWLRDECKVLSVGGVSVAVVGSRGTIERPTSWQARNVPGIARRFREREGRVRELLRRARSRGYLTILATHYAPTYATLEGERSYAWPFLGSLRMERVVREVKPDLVLHGHAHNSKRTFALVDGVPVYNVSLPATGRITVVEVSRRLKDVSPLFRF